jgi:hypothetical protein
LAQGTLYPDVIESVSFKGPSATIKTHRNVGGLPSNMRFKLVDPLIVVLWHRLRERPVSESGRLRQGAGGHLGGDRRRSVLIRFYDISLLQGRSRPPAASSGVTSIPQTGSTVGLGDGASGARTARPDPLPSWRWWLGLSMEDSSGLVHTMPRRSRNTAERS